MTTWPSIRAIALVCIVVGFLLSQSMSAGQTTAQALPSGRLAAEQCTAKGQVGTINKVVGKVKIKHGSEQVTAKHGARVYKGDLVKTAAGQKVSVTVCGGASVYMNEKSSAQINSRVDLAVKSGEVAEQVSSQGAHTARTSEAVSRSHGKGTYFDVRSQSGGSEFVVAKGTLEVSNKQGKVQLTQDKATTVRAGHAPDPAKTVNAQQLINWTSTLAGSGSWRILTAAGLLQEPQRLAVDAQGNIYVTDPGTTDGRVLKLSPAGKVVATWHLQGSAASPSGIAVDTQNNVYVTDDLAATVQKLSPAGQVLANYGLQSLFPDASLTGVDVDAAGNLYVADDYGDRVIKLSSSGQVLATWGSKGSGNGQFDTPEDVAVDTQGNIYVADQFNDRIEKLSSNGRFVTAWSTGEDSSPVDVAIAPGGNLYVVEANAGRIQEFSPSGTVVWAWQSDPLGNLQASGEFDQPSGVAVDKSGNIYVADHYNGRVQAITRSG